MTRRSGEQRARVRGILQDQYGLCAICLKKLTEEEGRLDHCHSSGRVRGVLCHSCNVGIGHFKDKPEVLWRAIEYLSPYYIPERLNDMRRGA